MITDVDVSTINGISPFFTSTDASLLKDVTATCSDLPHLRDEDSLERERLERDGIEPISYIPFNSEELRMYFKHAFRITDDIYRRRLKILDTPNHNGVWIYGLPTGEFPINDDQLDSKIRGIVKVVNRTLVEFREDVIRNENKRELERERRGSGFLGGGL